MEASEEAEGMGLIWATGLRISAAVVLGAFALWGVAQTESAPSEAQAFFTNSVQPVLRTNCLPCHTTRNRTSGLALDSRDEILAGGNRGPAVKLGDPDASLMIAAIEHRGELKMPLGRRLKDEDAAVLRRWVELGLPWPDGGAPAKHPGADHWAFRAPERPAVSEVRNRT